MKLVKYVVLSVLAAACLLGAEASVVAQVASQSTATAPISRGETTQTDREIRERLKAIYDEIDTLSAVTVWVRKGVIVLSGKVANESSAERAVRLAHRIDGAVEVEDEIARTLSVEDNLNPLLEKTEDAILTATRAWPLYAVAVLAFILVTFFGHLVASAGRFWRWVAPNPFIAGLIAQSIRIVSILGGILLALSILDAMALFGAAAGGAGLVGLAVGFAVKDTIENYIASVMLSLRQPFRADDHVVINDLEGVVVRLTSRATILMTLDGNHLRIPNADVFKGVILNYTLNPQRRFSFKLGIDANDNPIDAANAGLETLQALDFILNEPQASAGIDEVGDSNIVLAFYGWIDQRETDFQKARSAAINSVKTVLEEQGFTLPEPIYRVKIDGLEGVIGHTVSPAQNDKPQKPRPTHDKKPRAAEARPAVVVDVSPDEDVRRQVAEDRARGGDQEDLLSDNRPIE
ncbi:mechanosensitive ion channel [Hoeflea sp. G2-23]|uniref:Small-conductance mechanosensitive channel n=1 Tax=Hoeflea algicola TaxID=2983763 RepID=A0ABT3Z7H3_9HYPH|nr:mechanosensitive ion channel domain-containing protein [Hoeflea algicola]MCY0147674.1 mechanosensitive ion channel [Hoeflea algicola]